MIDVRWSENNRDRTLMEMDQFFRDVKNRKIPDGPPNTYMSGDYMLHSRGREFCTERGMWAIVYRTWTDQLAEWIGDRKVLEIMAGYGWLARALADAGVSVIASDNGSWNNIPHRRIRKPLYDIHEIDAIDAIHKFDYDVVICSWPPYGDDEIVRVANELYYMYQDKDFVYIGESWGGCNAPQVFFSMFMPYDEQPVDKFMNWNGIHDEVVVGRILYDAHSSHIKLLKDKWYARDYVTDEENVYLGIDEGQGRILVSLDGEYKEI